MLVGKDVKGKFEYGLVTTPGVKQMVFSEIISSSHPLMTDVFGNYVIQKFFEYGTPEQKSQLVQKVTKKRCHFFLHIWGGVPITKTFKEKSSRNGLLPWLRNQDVESKNNKKYIFQLPTKIMLNGNYIIQRNHSTSL